VGAYQLEVSLGGHYGFNEPVRVSSRALTRETVELLPLSAGAHAGIPSSTPGGATAAVGREPSSVPGWVPWTLAGVGVAAAAVGTVAWIQRQDHADRWHDDSACLNVPGATRASLCGDERTRGLRAQTIALTSGGLALGFATAAVWTALAGSADTEEEVGLASCGIGLGDLNCSGHF
jgi:hypothetical protein